VFLACDPHPEFGYVGSPRLCRQLGLFLAFMILIVGVSGITIFTSYPDPDPTNAMALAPPEALSGTAYPTTPEIAESNSGKGEFARETGAIKPRCYENAAEHPDGDCIAGHKRRPRSILAINERPAIAAVPIGHRDDPTVLLPEPSIPAAAMPSAESTSPTAIAAFPIGRRDGPTVLLSEPAAPIVAALPEDAETATPAEGTPSAERASPRPLPSVTPTKTRERHRERAREANRAPRRERREYASTSRYYSNRQAYGAYTVQRGAWGGLW
jgi:hypothetical protein